MGLREFLAKARESTHTETISGTEFTFYPVRVASILRAQSVVSEVARAVSAFFDPNENAYQRSEVVHIEAEGAQQVNTEPVSPEHAHARIKRRDAAVARACEQLLGEESMTKVVWLVLDSLREENISPEQFIEQAEGADLVQFVRGMMLANAPTFGPLVQKALSKMEGQFSVEQPPEEDKPKIPDPK